MYMCRHVCIKNNFFTEYLRTTTSKILGIFVFTKGYVIHKLNFAVATYVFYTSNILMTKKGKTISKIPQLY